MTDADTTATAPAGLTDEEKAKELQGRIEEFNKELIPLLGKYELGLGASAFINPEGTIGSRPIVFDMRGQNKPAEEAAKEPAETTPEAPAEEAVTAA